MSAAVASPPQDTLVSQPAREVLYTARRENLKLVHTKIRWIRDSSGEQVGATEGVRIPFTAGVLRVPLEGEIRTEQGNLIDAAELNVWLHKHRLFGDPFEGFTEIQQVAPPIGEDEFDLITQATVRHDVDALTALLGAERAAWNRPAMVGRIETALAQVAEVAAMVEAQVRAQVEAEGGEAEKPTQRGGRRATS